MRKAIAILSLLVVGTFACDSSSGGNPDRDGAIGDGATLQDVEPGDGLSGDAGPEVIEPKKPRERTELIHEEEVNIMFMGMGGPVTFEAPEHTVSLSVTLVGDDDAAMIFLTHWGGPNGFDLVYDGWLESSANQGICMDCKNRIMMSETVFGAIAPNNPEAHVEAGEYTMSLMGIIQPPMAPGRGECGDGICQYSEFNTCPQDCGMKNYRGPVQVLVHAKIVEPEGDVPADVPETGILDMNLFFTGAQGLTAESAQTDTYFQAQLAHVAEIYGKIGISFGDVKYYDTEERFRIIESVDGEGADLLEMFAATEEANQEAVNLFFVDELAAATTGGFGVILGIAGGIPGPAIHGTGRSGVAIVVKPMQGMENDYATTIAHEVGHYLGLYHTTEQNFMGGPAMHDPLPDTPQNDDSYLMYWTGSGDKMSPWQGRIMRSSPWVRHEAGESK